MENCEIITLYHGSKYGLNGTINPISREHCDFGKGFYMGTEKTQPLTLICNYPASRFYTLKLDLTSLQVLHVDISLDWALLIAYNRGSMNGVMQTKIYDKYKHFTDGYDVIVGYIANDRMFTVLDRFFNGEITDAALISSLSALKLGIQYVAVTEKACARISIINEYKLSALEREDLKVKSDSNRVDGKRLADETCRLHRRDGRFFDEILALQSDDDVV